MRKVLIIFIPFFIIVSILAGIEYQKDSIRDKDTGTPSYDSEEIYPEELRLIATSNGDEQDNQDLEQEEELASDEDFVDFEIEEEEQTPEETGTDGEESQPQIPEEGSSETSTEEESAEVEVEMLAKVNARISPENTAKIIAVYGVGERGVLIEEGEHWSIIKVGDSQGYVSNKFWKKI